MFVSPANPAPQSRTPGVTSDLNFVRCTTCGCIMNWERIQPRKENYMGVNARNFEPSALCNVRIRRLDGADTWKYVD